MAAAAGASPAAKRRTASMLFIVPSIPLLRPGSAGCPVPWHTAQTAVVQVCAFPAQLHSGPGTRSLTSPVARIKPRMFRIMKLQP